MLGAQPSLILCSFRLEDKLVNTYYCNANLFNPFDTMSTISLKDLNPDNFDQVRAAVDEYTRAKDALDAAEAKLKTLGVVLGKKRGRKPGSTAGQPYTGKKRGRKPKNAQA